MGNTGTQDVPTPSAQTSSLATVDFGFPARGEGDVAVVTVTAPWITATGRVACTLFSSPDHDEDDILAEGLHAYAINRNPGVGFDIKVCAPRNTWGRYQVSAMGIG